MSAKVTVQNDTEAASAKCGIAYLLRSVNSAGTARETYVGSTYGTIEDALSDNNAGKLRGSKPYAPFEAAMWVEGLLKPEKFVTQLSGLAGMSVLEEMQKFLATRKKELSSDFKSTATELRALKILLLLCRENLKCKVYMAMRIPNGFMPDIPSTIKIEERKCPWADRPLPITKPKPEKVKTSKKRRAPSTDTTSKTKTKTGSEALEALKPFISNIIREINPLRLPGTNHPKVQAIADVIVRQASELQIFIGYHTDEKDEKASTQITKSEEDEPHEETSETTRIQHPSGAQTSEPPPEVDFLKDDDEP